MKTRPVKVGNVIIGGGFPVVIQSMINTETSDVHSTVKQIRELEKAGCEIVRLAVPDMCSARALGRIKEKIRIPLVADIHFDWRLAIEALNQGVDKLRLNPGNIKDRKKVAEIAQIAMQKNVAIRIGVNSGSIDRSKYDTASARNLFESAKNHIKILEDTGFQNIVVSLKSTDVLTTIEANRIFAKQYKYPLHIGITEAGTEETAAIKNAIGIGILLNEGIGDTIRVSITGNPIKEVLVAKKILSALNLRSFGVSIISCPTCGRMQIDVEKLARELEKKTVNLKKNIKIAVMGCVVNGPGEARECDLGIAGDKGEAMLFKKGKIVGRVESGDIIKTILSAIKK